MIDRVNNQKYYEYSKVNQQKRETTESSEFNLNLGNQGVIYEKSEQKKAAKPKPGAAAESDTKPGSMQGAKGVKLEISQQGYEKSKEGKQRSPLLEQVKKYAAAAVELLKSVWDKIWNDPTPPKAEFPEILEEKMAGQEEGEEGIKPDGTSLEEALQVSGQKTEPGEMRQDTGVSVFGAFFSPGASAAQRKAADTPEPSYTQEEIRRLFQRGSRKEIEDFLSNHGEKRLAKNTELLTQYDKKGSLVGISQSDKELILYGDKSREV